MENLNDVNWLSGIIEGEGCINTNGKISPEISVAMTDKDVMERVAKLLDSNISTRILPSDKILYKTTIGGQRAAELLADLYDYFGERRKAKTLEVLTIWADSLSIDPYLCKSGHLMEPDNTRIVTDINLQDHRNCRRCDRKNTLFSLIRNIT